MRPDVRPRKLTRRSASPSAKVLRMMASVSRAGMKFKRDRLGRRVRKVPEQAGRTCRTRLNTTGEEASQCWRGGVVEEIRERSRRSVIRKGFSIWENLQVLLSMSARRHFLGGRWYRLRESESRPSGAGLRFPAAPALTHWAKFC